MTVIINAGAPTVSSVAPNSGSTIGGTSVTITGTGFTGATAVTFGGTAATGITVVNDTTITASTPPHAAGAVAVAVTAPSGTASLPNGFTYSALNRKCRIYSS
ncbi:IPT/TIG domain-containing protein [Nitrobacter vulgaris]|uniref:IPT/TIG domain-containing protein n=1 Tax=Nitrobacter vulgaris TaxID=29421 RepID=UPI0035B53C5A